MTIPFSTIISPAFQEAFKRALATRVSSRTGYWLAKLSSIFEVELLLFNTQRDKLVTELGQPVKDQPGQYQIPTEKMQQFVNELSSLDHSVELGLPPDLKLELPQDFIPEDWIGLIALDLFNPPT